jgi:hypothetical protein
MKTYIQAIDHFYSDSAAQSNASSASTSAGAGASSAKSIEKKLGDIWEGYKGEFVRLEQGLVILKLLACFTLIRFTATAHLARSWPCQTHRPLT